MVPRFTDFYIPVLHVMSDIEPIEINDLIDKVALHVNLSEGDKKETTGGGSQLRYRSNICWAVTDLNQGTFIERVKRGNYVITLKGLELLEENPPKIDRDFLASRSESFRDFLERRGTRKQTNIESDYSNTYTKMIPKSLNIENNASNNDSVNCLEELYKAVTTLRKANISTVELENKILELESDILCNKLLNSLSEILPKNLYNIKRKVSFSIDYYPGESIKMTVGKRQRTIHIEEYTHTLSKDDSSGNNIPSYNIKISSSEINSRTDTDSSKTREPISNNKVHDLNKQRWNSKGVWLIYHSDRTIIIDGDTVPFTNLFKSYGGVKMSNTQGVSAWMFMRNREEGLRRDLNGYIIPEPKKEVKEFFNDTANKEIIINKSDKLSGSNIHVSDNIVNGYIEKLNKLKPFNFLGITGPHKAILLITIFKEIRYKKVIENKIYYTDELESSYNAYWKKYVGGTPSLGAVYPFMHLGRESFFFHKLNKGIKEYDTTWSQHKVNTYVKYAILDRRLFEIIKNDDAYNSIKQFLIERYCCNTVKQDPSQSEEYYDDGLNQDVIDFDNSQFKIDQSNSEHAQESFREYLKKSGSKNGKAYTNSSISVYLGALNSLYLINIVYKYHKTGDIFNIKDIGVLLKIKDKVEKDCDNKVGSTLCRSALASYIRFVNDYIENK